MSADNKMAADIPSMSETPPSSTGLTLADHITRIRGRLRKRLLRVAEQFAYDVAGLPLALGHLLHPGRPSPDLPPGDYVHRYYGWTYWHLPWGPLRGLIAASVWPVALVVTVIVFTSRNGSAIAARSGVSVADQILGQIGMAARQAIAPFWFYMFELYDPARKPKAALYLTAHETIGPAYEILQPSADADGLDDKVWFARHCREHGIEAVPVLFLISGGVMLPQVEGIESLPDADLFVKPRSGSGGHRMERWDTLGDGRFRSSSGETLTREALAARLMQQSLKDDFLVQPRLANHPALDDISNGALATVRLLTMRNEHGAVEATNAAFRMAVGGNSVVDNFHQGGLATAIDLATGEIGEASDMGISPQMGWREVHPVSGARFAGRVLPHWSQVVSLAIRTHEAFPERVVVGWDVAMLADGACIIEGNGRPDLDIHQRVERAPLGANRIANLLAFNVRKMLDQT